MAVIWITPSEVTIGSTDTWLDIDVSGESGYVSSVTGVILRIVENSGANVAVGVRKNGSTDNRVTYLGSLGQVTAHIGVDSGGIFEAYAASTGAIDFWLVGYHTDDASFFTNAVDKSQDTINTWIDTDISSDTGGDTAIAALFEYAGGSNYAAAVRKNGSTDSITNTISRHLWGCIGVDGSEIFEQYIGNTGKDLFLVGYVTKESTWNTNGTDRSLGSTGSYINLTALPSGATGGVYLIDGGFEDIFALRSNDQTSQDWYYEAGGHSYALITTKCDSSQIVEGKIDTVNTDFYEIGYFEAAGGMLPFSRPLMTGGMDDMVGGMTH